MKRSDLRNRCAHDVARPCQLESDAGAYAFGLICQNCGSFAAWTKIGPYWKWGPPVSNKLTSKQMPNGYPEGSRITILGPPCIEKDHDRARAIITYSVEKYLNELQSNSIEGPTDRKGVFGK